MNSLNLSQKLSALLLFVIASLHLGSAFRIYELHISMWEIPQLISMCISITSYVLSFRLLVLVNKEE